VKAQIVFKNQFWKIQSKDQKSKQSLALITGEDFAEYDDVNIFSMAKRFVNINRKISYFQFFCSNRSSDDWLMNS